MDPMLKKKRVLSVEDDEANQFLMQLLLRKIGCSFDLAENGQEAVDKVKANKFNLIFMDLRMPVLDGFEATEIIRKDIDKTVPIVAVSAHVLKEVVDKCFAVGMNAFIAKGIEIKKFERELLSWVEKS
jgi:two-component system, sensor histidine kinase